MRYWDGAAWVESGPDASETPAKAPARYWKRYLKRWPLTALVVGGSQAAVSTLSRIIFLAREGFDWVSKDVLFVGAIQFVLSAVIFGSIVNLLVARYPDRPK
jgi:hypothetical protein